MKVNVKGSDIQLHYSLRIYLIYENITGKSLDVTDPSYSVTINLFYAAILASCQHEHRDLDFDYDEYLDWLDSNLESMTEFVKWFIQNMRVNSSLIKKDPEEQKDAEPLPKN